MYNKNSAKWEMLILFLDRTSLGTTSRHCRACSIPDTKVTRRGIWKHFLNALERNPRLHLREMGCEIFRVIISSITSQSAPRLGCPPKVGRSRCAGPEVRQVFGHMGDTSWHLEAFPKCLGEKLSPPLARAGSRDFPEEEFSPSLREVPLVWGVHRKWGGPGVQVQR